MSEIILETRNLSKLYNGLPALANVNITINKGDIYGFVGKNGAGKTTFMRVISGLISPSGGDFTLMGVSNSNTKLINRNRGKISSIIEGPALFLNMTAMDNMKQQSILTNSSANLSELLDMVDLRDVGNKKAKDFSLGMKQRLGIAMSLVSQPEFMLLDEPTNGLDPEGIQHIRTLLKRLNTELGITIMISSHILTELSLIATRYGFIHRGRLINEISTEDIAAKAKSRMELTVTDVGKALIVLKLMDVDCVISNGKLNIKNDSDIAEIAIKLKESDIQILKVETVSFDLERYFVEVLKGEHGVTNNKPANPFMGGSV